MNLDTVIQEINKKYGDEIIRTGTGRIFKDRIPFSSVRLNYITYGGIPLGKVTEFLGADGSGKTTTALDLAGQAQKLAEEEYQQKIKDLEEEVTRVSGKKKQQLETEINKIKMRGKRKVIYIDAENTLDENWAVKNGVDIDELILMIPQEQSAEQVLQMIIDLTMTGEVILIVLDSLPMLVPQAVFENDMEKKSYGGIAGAMSVFCSKICSRLARNKTGLIIINQIRDDMKNPFNIFHTPGGRALKHIYSLRLAFRKGKFIGKDGEELTNAAEDPKGNIVDVVIVKTKICPPKRRVGGYNLKYDEGIDVLNDLIYLAIKFDIIIQAGAWFTIFGNDDLKFQGKKRLTEYLEKNSPIVKDINNMVYEKIKEGY